MAKAVKSFTKNLKSLASAETLKDGGLVAAGGVGTPIMSGIVQGLLNRARPGMIDPAGPLAKAVDLLSAALLGTVVTFVAKNPKTARMVVLGGMSGVMSDIANETIVPALKLGDYLTLPPGMADYLTLPPGMRDYIPRRAMADYLAVGKRGNLKDWASVQQVADAGPSYSPNETF